MWAKSRSRIAANVWPTGGGIGSTQPWGRLVRVTRSPPSTRRTHQSRTAMRLRQNDNESHTGEDVNGSYL